MNPDRIRPLQDLAATARDAAAARLARANDALQAAEQKLCELQTYAAEYGAAIAAGRPGARLLQNRRVFHSRLLDAIAAQRREVERQRGLLESVRLDCVSARQRTRSLDRLEEIQRQQARQAATRAAQKEQDDGARSNGGFGVA